MESIGTTINTWQHASWTGDISKWLLHASMTSMFSGHSWPAKEADQATNSSTILKLSFQQSTLHLARRYTSLKLGQIKKELIQHTSTCLIYIASRTPLRAWPSTPCNCIICSPEGNASSIPLMHCPVPVNRALKNGETDAKTILCALKHSPSTDFSPTSQSKLDSHSSLRQEFSSNRLLNMNLCA